MIVAKHSGKCLNVKRENVGDGVAIQQYTCVGAPNDLWLLDNHFYEKRLHPDRWYQRLADTGSYASWMTLSTHRHYEPGLGTPWSTPISNALNSYNSSSQPGGTHTVLMAEYAPAYWHDIHIWATKDGCVSDTYSIPSTGQQATRDYCTFAYGQVFRLDEGFHDCPGGDCDSSHSRPDTWWFVTVLVNEQTHIDQQDDNPWFRQGTAAHELGHAIVLRHDYSPEYGEFSDGDCTYPQTIMDGDCIFNGDLNAPQTWDSCGTNHAYYDPNWGWSGC